MGGAETDINECRVMGSKNEVWEGMEGGVV